MTPHEALILAYKRLDEGLVDTSSGDTWVEISYNEWDANYWVDKESDTIKVAVYRVIADNEGAFTDYNDFYEGERDA